MLAIIGGSGLDQMKGLRRLEERSLSTPYGEPSAALLLGELEGQPLVFLPRHGQDHQLPPHKINYRANIWALKSLGVRHLVGVASVGGISAHLSPGTIVIPDQLLDYTHGREQTFFDGNGQKVEHIDFTEPYCETLRQQLCKAATRAQVQVVEQSCYGVTQGPRLETRAEIQKLKRDGADMVGMTAMPEAALACEAGLCYANCALVVNWAAGLGAGGPILWEQMADALVTGMDSILAILGKLEID